MLQRPLPVLIRSASARYKINQELIAGIIMQESAGNPKAARYEDNFYRRYVATKSREELLDHVPPESICTTETEKRLRAFSFGRLAGLQAPPLRRVLAVRSQQVD